MQQNKMTRVLIGGIVGLVLFLATNPFLTNSVVASPERQTSFPTTPSQYYYSTGHYVTGPFLTFYNTRGATRVFGYPQTEAFYDARTGLWVQYFDNVRMEWHPGNPDPYKVQLGLLAELLGHRTPRISSDQAPFDNPFRRYFAATGHVVSYAFLVYYDQNGGLDIFGYPISEPMVENGRIVQYFQRARMEWHPERPRDERVILGSLGSAYIQRFGVPAEYRARQPQPQAPSQADPEAVVSSLRVWTFVRNVITGREGDQIVYVYVTDAARDPVVGATAVVNVRFASGTVQYTTGRTNDRGIASITFPIHSPPPGQRVVVDVSVQYGGQTQDAQTFFVPWY